MCPCGVMVKALDCGIVVSEFKLQLLYYYKITHLLFSAKYIYIYIHYRSKLSGVCPRGVVASILDCNIIVSKYKFQLHYYVYFQTNKFGERHEPPYPLPSHGLNSITAVVLEGWLWH